MDIIIRRANKQDLPNLRSFLTRAGLGTDGITEEALEYFLLLEDEHKLWKGTLGIEPFQQNGLLRSLVIAPGQEENQIILLFEQALALAKAKNMAHLFLATNKGLAISFFKMLGFQSIEKSELPKELYDSDHIKHILNVDNSLFLKLAL